MPSSRRSAWARWRKWRKEGRTVLFVSHNMPPVENLCSSAILLAGGQVRGFDHVQAVLASYLAGLQAPIPSQVTFEEQPTAGFAEAYIESNGGGNGSAIRMGDLLVIVVRLNRATNANAAHVIGFSIENERGVKIGGFHTGMRKADTTTIAGNRSTYRFEMDRLKFESGFLRLNASPDRWDDRVP